MGFVFEFYFLSTENKMEYLDLSWMVIGGIICICGILF